MKKVFLLVGFLPFFLTSCNNDSYLIEYILIYSQELETAKYQCSKLDEKFQYAYNFPGTVIATNESESKKLDIINSLNNNYLLITLQSRDLVSNIESLKTFKRGVELKFSDLDNYINSQASLNKVDTENLEASIQDFQKKCLDILNEVKRGNEHIDFIKGVFTSEKWSEFSSFSGEKVSHLGIIADLCKLQSEVKIVEQKVASAILSELPSTNNSFNKIESFVELSQTKLKQSENLSAKIYMSITDTTQQPEIYIDKTKLKVVEKHGVYSTRIPKDTKPGKYTIKGYYKQYVYSIGSTLGFPFRFEYEVVE